MSAHWRQPRWGANLEFRGANLEATTVCFLHWIPVCYWVLSKVIPRLIFVFFGNGGGNLGFGEGIIAIPRILMIASICLLKSFSDSISLLLRSLLWCLTNLSTSSDLCLTKMSIPCWVAIRSSSGVIRRYTIGGGGGNAGRGRIPVGQKIGLL